MKDRNELIYRVRQIIGDETEDGFYTPIQWNNEIIQVPNFLFKDGQSKYPEIRISPFLRESKASHSIRIRDYNSDRKSTYYNTRFQIDIYATNVVLVNKIYDAVTKRIKLFYDIDNIIYGYDEHFDLIDSEQNIYYNKMYQHFKIISVRFGSFLLKKVTQKQELKQKNTYYVDKTGLYVNTDFNIKFIAVNVVLNGLVFPDGDTAHHKGIIKTRIMNRRSLSNLENNIVERVSFELGILYRMDSERNPGPLATSIVVDSDSD